MFLNILRKNTQQFKIFINVTNYFPKIPDLLVVYRFSSEHLEKIYGMDITKVDLSKLDKILMENMEIGKEEAKRLKLLDPLLGYATIVNDLGLVVIKDMVYFVRLRRLTGTM